MFQLAIAVDVEVHPSGSVREVEAVAGHVDENRGGADQSQVRRIERPGCTEATRRAAAAVRTAHPESVGRGADRTGPIEAGRRARAGDGAGQITRIRLRVLAVPELPALRGHGRA